MTGVAFDYEAVNGAGESLELVGSSSMGLLCAS